MDEVQACTGQGAKDGGKRAERATSGRTGGGLRRTRRMLGLVAMELLELLVVARRELADLR